MFVTADSIVPRLFDPQTLNRYSYCRNNPLIYVDPSGHEFNTPLEQWVSKAYSTLMGDKAFYVDPYTALEMQEKFEKRVKTIAGIIAILGLTEFILDNFPNDEEVTTEEESDGTGNPPSGEEDKITVRHYTNDEGQDAIKKSGELRPGTYVTKPTEIPTTANQEEIEKALEISSGKGKNYIDIEVKKSQLKTPDDGPTTSGGKWQGQTTEPIKVDSNNWKRSSGDQEE